MISDKVVIDQIYSHTSDRHPRLEESRSNRENPKADWYVWAEAKPEGSPPNNWQSVFAARRGSGTADAVNAALRDARLDHHLPGRGTRSSPSGCAVRPASGTPKRSPIGRIRWAAMAGALQCPGRPRRRISASRPPSRGCLPLRSIEASRWTCSNKPRVRSSTSLATA